MAYSLKPFLTLILAWIVVSMATARPLNSASTLVARLQLDGQSNCWGSLFELQSCTGEVVLFFLNGETHLGPSCCRAIRIIEHRCWPSMLGSLGFTDQEEDILRGYCDVFDDTTHGLPSSPSPPLHDQVASENISMQLVP